MRRRIHRKPFTKIGRCLIETPSPASQALSLSRCELSAFSIIGSATERLVSPRLEVAVHPENFLVEVTHPDPLADALSKSTMWWRGARII